MSYVVEKVFHNLPLPVCCCREFNFKKSSYPLFEGTKLSDGDAGGD